jgi:hypothetical protein
MKSSFLSAFALALPCAGVSCHQVFNAGSTERQLIVGMALGWWLVIH